MKNMLFAQWSDSKPDKRRKFHPDVLIEEVGEMLQVLVRIGKLVDLQA